MSALSKAELVEPAKARMIAIFEGLASGLTERLHPAVTRIAATSRLAANAVAAFLPLIAMLAYVFAAWRLGSDFGWMGEFPVATGLFSHWLVWVGVGSGIQMTGSLLNRPPKGEVTR